jgi:hypothetical protein
MQEKYKVLNMLELDVLETIYQLSDLTDDEYWALKYTLGIDKHGKKIGLFRRDICDRLNCSLSTLTNIKNVALAKAYKTYKDHLLKLKKD